MPGYSYRYRRRYGRRYSRYRRYSASYSRYRRRRSGTSSTASSRGRIRVRVPVQQVLSISVPANSLDSEVVTSTPYIRLLADDQPRGCCSAVQTPLYNAYAQLYDQVKCDGVVTRFSILTAIGGTTMPAIQVVMAYDRYGNRNEVSLLSSAGGQVTTSQLFNFSSASVVSAINNSVAKTSRSCWSSDIQERTSFHDCSVAVGDGTTPYLYADRDFYSSPSKLSYFAPLTMIGLRLSAAPAEQITVSALIEQTYYFTFRNPKFGGSASASSASVQSIPVMATRRDTRSLDREAGMADLGLDEEDAVVSAPVSRAPRRTPLSELWNDARRVPLPQ
ncbi:putative capsid protein [Hudisavirus sp.]|nr:putative capsid protein [Hudisavirus sp.]